MHLIGWNIVHNRYRHEPLPLHKKTHNGLKESIKSTGPMRKNKQGHTKVKQTGVHRDWHRPAYSFVMDAEPANINQGRRNASGNANLIWTSVGL